MNANVLVQTVQEKITAVELARTDCLTFLDGVHSDILAAHSDFLDAYFVANPTNPTKAEFLAAVATARSTAGYKIAASKQSDLSLVRNR
jgi:hypothetical protein